MSAGSLVGKECKVTIGATSVLGMGTWAINGVTSDMLDNSEFGDEIKKYLVGMKDGGSVTFEGIFKPSDQTGQQILNAALWAGTNITTLRLYVDNTSYFEPCQTTGYLSPDQTTGESTELSYLNVQSLNVSQDKEAIGQVGFDLKLSGCMVLI